MKAMFQKTFLVLAALATLSPALASEFSSDVSFNISLSGSLWGNCSNNGAACKQAVVRLAAVEAAEYINSGAIGPMLESLAEENQDMSFDDLLENVLKAADSL